MKHPYGTCIATNADFAWDLDALIDSRMLIQANSGGGKSYASRKLLEVTHGRIQQIIIDPEGEFSTLREKYDYVVASPRDGDALAHPSTAKLLCERLLETGVSAICDIYELTKKQRTQFVQRFLDTMVNAPKNLWHPVIVLLDEAHVYAPESETSEAHGAVADLATRGRKRGFCLVAATQRISKLSKDVAAELNNKLIGRATLDVDIKRAAGELGISTKEATERLRNLDAGQFFCFGPATPFNAPTLVTVGTVVTRHPKRGERASATPKPTKAILDVLPKLADLPKEAEAELRTVEGLRTELGKLRGELAAAKKAAPAVPKSTAIAAVAAAGAENKLLRQAAVKRVRALESANEALMKFVINIDAQNFSQALSDDAGEIRKKLEAAASAAVETAMRTVEQRITSRTKVLEELQAQGKRLMERINASLKETDGATVEINVNPNPPFSAAAVPARPAKREPGAVHMLSDASLAKGEARILGALIQHDGCRPEQLAVLCGYKRSARDAYLSLLRSRGYADRNGEKWSATDDGRAALPDFEPLPTGAALLEHWRERLPPGERKLLEVIVEAAPGQISIEALSEATSYKRSARDAYLSRLANRNLIEKPERGFVRACEALR